MPSARTLLDTSRRRIAGGARVAKRLLTTSERGSADRTSEVAEHDPEPVDTQTEIVSVWDRHHDETYRQDQSHWRGTGRWDDERWTTIGQETWRRVQDLYHTAHRSYPTDPPPVVLEWGPGGGSNLAAFAPHAAALYGVDISRKNLDESGRVVAESAETPYTPIHLVDTPESVVSQIGRPIDLFISTSVFQHFPSPEYGADVLRTMRTLMSPGAMAYVQIRFDNGNPMFAAKPIADYRASHLTATSYQLSEFWDLLVESGFNPLKIAKVNTTSNYAGFYFSTPN